MALDFNKFGHINPEYLALAYHREEGVGAYVIAKQADRRWKITYTLDANDAHSAELSLGHSYTLAHAKSFCEAHDLAGIWRDAPVVVAARNARLGIA